MLLTTLIMRLSNPFQAALVSKIPDNHFIDSPHHHKHQLWRILAITLATQHSRDAAWFSVWHPMKLSHLCAPRTIPDAGKSVTRNCGSGHSGNSAPNKSVWTCWARRGSKNSLWGTGSWLLTFSLSTLYCLSRACLSLCQGQSLSSVTLKLANCLNFTKGK